ncbi:lysophosphatidic acid phosphatase type 6 [Syngnathoides biaculeatus]|uniref:lysophosphatidic acid phosphatase type 6 n=1 Tax=Syngnathoides biaculeatus TaxID=300417 RepID=UPI002ADDE011|nr:lysophosphatidic acid phosphatase type 6 [Syngnathoides biaculeatus]XP_061698537.1 lysophosphatidic acid phosphatase type 6 [Syngnathoides biaculeatus]XP_061698538.1 lysophosphatidic acid phosphatase type 6 [Syngnathoides biaculeatus]XP_061698539.1 lysophosphatidic acid phosphatase type 6 [Syngnathoides biaculeatus]
MRKLWTKVGVFGSVTIAFGSVWWWRQRSADGGSKASPYELKLVQVLFRHGARTPLKSIPDVLQAQWVPTLLEPPAHTHIDYVVTDLDGGPRPPSPLEDSYRKKKLSGGVFAGQLTTLGMQQLFELGEKMRRRYVQEVPFLSPTFCRDEVYVRSTNIVRTIESAKCLLAGLFQQKQKEIVPILTTNAESEILYPNYHGCRLLRTLSGARLQEVVLLPDVAADLKSIRRELGIGNKPDVDFVLIRDDMVARQAHGLPSPPALDTWRSRVEQRAVDTMLYCYQPSKRENLQLCVGPLLHMFLLNIEQKLQGSSAEPNRKLFLYSAHDTTLIPCLMALGIFDMKWPPYAADVTLELHQHRRTKEAFVKVSYMGQDQLIPGCSGLYCPLQEFQKVLSAYSLDGDLYRSLCNSAGDPSKL